MRQVVSIAPDGTVSGLQTKPGRGFDLRALGAADIRRASEILWSHDAQAWFVSIMRGRYAGTELTTTMWREAGCEGAPALCQPVTVPGSVYLFRDYDDAVAAEIAFLDRIRLTEGSAALA